MKILPFFFVAYCFLAILFGAILIYWRAKFQRGDYEPSDKSRFWQFPFLAAIIYAYLFVSPWTRGPLTFEAFQKLAPGDSPFALIVRAVCCLAAVACIAFVTRSILRQGDSCSNGKGND